MRSVDESTGRAAVERVLEGVTDTQRQAGMVPGGQAAEEFARDVVIRQVQIHEERAGRAVVEPSGEPASPARLDRGDIPEDAELIDNTLAGPAADMTPQARRHMYGATLLPRHDQLMRARLEFLRQFPEWDARCWAAWTAGEYAAQTSGSELERTDAMRRLRRATEEVLKVLDASSVVFGDWRKPRADGRTKLILVPLAPKGEP